MFRAPDVLCHTFESSPLPSLRLCAPMQAFCDHCFVKITGGEDMKWDCNVCRKAVYCCEEHKEEAMTRHRGEMCECFLRVGVVNLYEVLDEEFWEEDATDARHHLDSLQRSIDVSSPQRLKIGRELRDSLNQGPEKDEVFVEETPESVEVCRVVVRI